MGQHNPRPQRSNKNRILKGPTEKNNIVRRNSIGKENIDVRARGQLHGEKKKEHTSMEVEAKGIGIKRKERIHWRIFQLLRKMERNRSLKEKSWLWE